MNRRRYLGSANDCFKTFSSQLIKVDEPDIAGYASYTLIKEVSAPCMIGQTCLYDNGYRELKREKILTAEYAYALCSKLRKLFQ